MSISPHDTDFLGPPGRKKPGQALVEQLTEALAAAWERGERPRAEQLLAGHPELAANPELALQLVYEEVCLRQQHGQQVDPREVVQRFPQWRAELEVLLDCHQLLQVTPREPDFPEVGAHLGDFQLRAELGRGTKGRVVLATQTSLAGRPVVLKLTPGDGHEHLTLARLQHTHIVPLYGMQVFPERNLRALCMPYLGGATLAQLLLHLRARPPEQQTGKALLAALDAIQAAAPEPAPTQGPARRLLAQLSQVQAVCWLGACLADALHYAHERGLVHLDVKPSNVLLAADAQPLLLDFHLAREPLQAGGPVPEWFGGTPSFMSPEQEQAFQAVLDGRPIPRAVDQRSDIYSLGLLLYKALAGPKGLSEARAAWHGSWPRLDRLNRQVSRGLADVLHKCLAPEPRARYAHVAGLAADLRRHLNHLPLQGVSNRSWRERWRKWRHRRPHALLFLLLLAGLLGAGLAGAAYLWDQRRQRGEEARLALVEGTQQLDHHEYDRAEETLRRGQRLAESAPDGDALARQLAEQLRRARRERAVAQLHDGVERLRFFYAAEALPDANARMLENACRAWWDQRTRLLDRSVPPLPAALEQQLRADLLDLAAIWADLHVRLAPPAAKIQARREALRLLAEAEELFGSSSVLAHERQVQAAALGEKAPAGDGLPLAPRTAWEHYQLGRALLHEGDREGAAAAFARSLEEEPQRFWPNFYQGLCAYRQQHYEEAVRAFSVCIALAPRTAACYYNRGRAEEARGRAEEAVQDYGRALRLDSSLAAAALNRGLLHLRAREDARAEADLKHVLELEPRNAEARQALEILRRRKERRE